MLEYMKVYPGTKDLVKRYPEADRCLLYEAVMDYAFTGMLPEWPEDDLKWLVWELLRVKVDAAEKAMDNGRKGGKASHAKRSDDSNPAEDGSNPPPTPLEPMSKESATPIQPKEEVEIEIEEDIEKEKDKEKTAQARRDRAKETLAMFNRFWDVYPRKTAKQNAVKAFGKLNVDEALLNTMLTAIEKQKSSPQWSDPQYIPHPATWLNGHRWEDEVQQSAKNGKIAQTNYTQRSYEEAKPGELPDWYIRMIEDKQRAEAAEKAGINPAMPQWLAEDMLEEAMSG